MSTLLKVGPADHGRPMTRDEFMAADTVDGYDYELIEGKLYVSPQPNLPENRVEDWVCSRLKVYAQEHPTVLNYVTSKARVFVPRSDDLTSPEPDVAAYRDFPLDRPFRSVRWQDVSPVLVVEVLSLEDPDKDLVRNVALYLQVPSIKEYWLFDTRQDPERLRLQVRRRHRGRWQLLHFGPDETYTTRLLPGFELVVNPRR